MADINHGHTQVTIAEDDVLMGEGFASLLEAARVCLASKDDGRHLQLVTPEAARTMLMVEQYPTVLRNDGPRGRPWHVERLPSALPWRSDNREDADAYPA